MASEITQEMGIGGQVTSKTRFVDYIGIEAVTVTITDAIPTPFFFLFADVDTKSLETLRLACQVFARMNLSFYWYKTRKGYHIVSPCLLPLKLWDKGRRTLENILQNYYRNLVIRIEPKNGDSTECHYEHFNDGVYKESKQLHQILLSRFKLNNVVCADWIDTHLNFSKYKQLRIGKR